MKKTFLIFLTVCIGACTQQKIEPSVPSNNVLVNIAQDWGSNSELQDLRNKKLGSDDIELRFWSGFGVRGNKGIILKRKDGDWISQSVQVTDTLSISKLTPNSKLNQFWIKLKTEGVLTLPAEVERTDIAPDGHSYVVELKIGDVYRASALGYGSPVVEADRKVFAIADLFDKHLGTSIRGSSW